MLGRVAAEPWLAREPLLARFSSDGSRACTAFIRFIRDGARQPGLWRNLRANLYLGDEAFVEQVSGKIALRGDAGEIPSRQREPQPPAMPDFEKRFPCREDAILGAYASGAYTMKQIADHYGIHYSTVSRMLRRRSGRMLDCKT